MSHLLMDRLYVRLERLEASNRDLARAVDRLRDEVRL